jgi:hypothetical protein
MPSRTNSFASASSASSASSSGATTPTGASTFGDNKGIMFSIKTGNNRWRCTLQDRSAYERTKATRTNSTDSVASDVSL